MVNVLVERDQKGQIRRIIADGHAGLRKSGRDIVCAAVSVTMYTAAGALIDLLGLTNCYIDKDGHMDIQIPDTLSQDAAHTAEIILETTEIGLRQIELQYSKKVKIKEIILE
jgi:uncharacterized protein YsxB (DUF464 family)